ncbi:Enhancer of polycomb 2, variant 2 [Chamberlinius hualienensis]
MSSKFRARALDAAKPMPVFATDDLPDLTEFAAINRSVPQMPSGMDKEEECEHHLQRAMSARQTYGESTELVIPTPEVYECTISYEQLYPADYKTPRQLIHVQPSAMDNDVPDYDLDTEDEHWLKQQQKTLDISEHMFEEMIDRLEKGSGQQVVTLQEAKTLLKQDHDIVTAVYDYWLTKRLKMGLPLIPTVKTEKRDGSSNNNPYVAFRRRTEKMQTRKNRKNDEASYEKMLKLRRDLSRAVVLLDMIQKRELAKKELVQLGINLWEKRYKLGDFSGQLISELSAVKNNKPSYVAIHNNSNQFTINRQPDMTNRHMKVDVNVARKKREYKKRKHKDSQQMSSQTSATAVKYSDLDRSYALSLSSDDDLAAGVSPSEPEDENDPDGPFAFRRKKNCNYHAPILEGMGNWPWCSSEEGGLEFRNYRYCLTSLSKPKQRCIGFARRRVGRGGRILFDRVNSPMDDYWPVLTNSSNHLNGLQTNNEFLNEIKNDWLHFRPQSSSLMDEDDSKDANGEQEGESRNSSVNNVCATDSVGGSGFSYSFSGSADTDGDQGGGGNSNGGGVNVNNGDDCSMEFNIDSFQTHQEELQEMQRRQIERLSQNDGCGNSSEHSISSQSNSHFTVDSASAQFAVSAVITTTQVSGISNTLTSPQQQPQRNVAINPPPSDHLSVNHTNIGISNGPTIPSSNVVSIPTSNKLSNFSMSDKFSSSQSQSSLSLVLTIPPTRTSINSSVQNNSSPTNSFDTRTTGSFKSVLDMKSGQLGVSSETTVNRQDKDFIICLH